MLLSEKYAKAEDVPKNTVVMDNGRLRLTGEGIGKYIILNDLDPEDWKSKRLSHCTIVDQHKFIVLIRYDNSNYWSAMQDYNEDGQVTALSKLYDSKVHAANDAIELIEFDEEVNGKAVEGLNYMVIPVPFDPAITEDKP